MTLGDSRPYPALTLVIDQARGRESEVVDCINEALYALESHGVITGFTWGGAARLLGRGAAQERMEAQS